MVLTWQPCKPITNQSWIVLMAGCGWLRTIKPWHLAYTKTWLHRHSHKHKCFRDSSVRENVSLYRRFHKHKCFRIQVFVKTLVCIDTSTNTTVLRFKRWCKPWFGQTLESSHIRLDRNYFCNWNKSQYRLAPDLRFSSGQAMHDYTVRYSKAVVGKPSGVRVLFSYFGRTFRYKPYAVA